MKSLLDTHPQATGYALSAAIFIVGVIALVITGRAEVIPGEPIPGGVIVLGTFGVMSVFYGVFFAIWTHITFGGDI